MERDEERLSSLPANLRAEGYAGIPRYRAIREAALDGVFPAIQVRGLWHYQPSQTAEIAKALRLTKRATVTA